MTTTQTESAAWAPSRQLVATLLGLVGFAVGIVGVMAFVLSFNAVNHVAMPYAGPLAFMIPLLGDLTIAVMTAFVLLAELYDLKSPVARWTARILIALTVYLNAGTAHGVFGHIIHAAPPIVWALIVEVGQSTIRQLVGLASPTRIERLRPALWLLRPVPTFVTWRRMRVQQIPTYREAIDLEAATLAVGGRLRVLHGRGWRRHAPLSERLSLRLLRRGQRDASGIADVLRQHQETAQLLGSAHLGAPVAVDAPAEPSLRVIEPVFYSTPKTLPVPSFTPFTSQVTPFIADPVEKARELAKQGASYGQIGKQLGRSKTWAFNAVNSVNGSSV